ncbi:hypothetical protein DCC39_12690 [Pueribacillus theae]|uniref:Lipoprotein n=1 Tax=Pueribacillus theae TaxID=2171751 RepID=A0A2U1JY42_9BACI|nr:hypothetical protein [Pueribacillus theae]PWA09693.1 hypothetical protein DCC39_12690 [Pueribacillus theae]
MRKIAILLLPLSLSLMGACSNENTESEKVVKENEGSTGSHIDEHTWDELIEETDNEAMKGVVDETVTEKEEEIEKAKVATTTEDYEDLQSIDEGQFNPSDYEVRILTDNANKRVLMFIDDHDKRSFKTVNVKHDHFLKVIDIQQNQLVMKKNIS